MFQLKDKLILFGTVAQPNCTSFSRLHSGKATSIRKDLPNALKNLFKFIGHANSNGDLEQSLVNIDKLMVARRGSIQQSSSMPMDLEESEDEKVMSMLEEGGKICRKEKTPIYERKCSCGRGEREIWTEERKNICRNGVCMRE